MYNHNVLIFLFLSFILGSFGSCDKPEDEDKLRPRFILFIDDHDVKHVMDTQPPESRQRQKIIYSASSVKYLLFTRQNPIIPQSLSIENTEQLLESNFDAADSTVVIIHGWWGSIDAGLNAVVKEAYLYKMKVNIIIVDWTNDAHDVLYWNSVDKVPYVGKALAEFLEFLHAEAGASFDNMHLIGHSLGAHVAGNAGRHLKEGKLARITGLDPAGPLWNNNPDHLQDTDAIYVESIHTNGGFLGTLNEWGTANFYPNGGMMQPGCFLPTCSHSRSYHLFASTVLNDNLVGRKCDTICQMLIGNCNGETLNLGNSDLKKFGQGIYLLETSNSEPWII